MGQKVNPIGLRLGVNKTWQSRWYADPREYADLVLEDIKIRNLVSELPECKNADIAFLHSGSSETKFLNFQNAKMLILLRSKLFVIHSV